MLAVIFGGSGLIGRHLREEFSKRQMMAVRWSSHNRISIENYQHVVAIMNECSHVFNCAGYVDVEGAETHSAETFRTNTLGAENIARASSVIGATVIQVSTEFVFDGMQQTGPYDEYDIPRAHSIYARSKLAGEISVAVANPKYHIVRLQNVYGAGGKNDLSTLHARLKTGERLTLDNERLIQPTWAGTAAKYLIDIAESERYGVWHVSCSKPITRFRFAQELEGGSNACAVNSNAFKLKVKRPSILLTGRRLEMLGMSPVSTWQESLNEYLLSVAAQ